MKLSLTIITTCIALTSQAALAAKSVSVEVLSTANIFAAGSVSPFAGTLPIMISVPKHSSGFRFEGTGSVSPYYSLYDLGPEGIVGQTTSINSYGGISGYAGDYGFPLVGVFLSNSEPQFPPPATLVFSTNSVGRNFTSLFPAIGQVFFIGDGKTDNNITQTFYAPSGATRLYLGFPDAPDFAGDPGNYFDNYGSLSIQVKIGKFHTK